VSIVAGDTYDKRSMTAHTRAILANKIDRTKPPQIRIFAKVRAVRSMFRGAPRG
jgi:hypothetical protein